MNNFPYVIAEVGQNHQGDYEIAREYIQIFAAEGANAIKFQMRDNKTLFTKEAYNRPYFSNTAFDEIYGKHREKLELSREEIKKLKEECVKYNVDFMVTPFDYGSLEFLIEINVDILKIASFDIGNIPFIEKIAQSGKTIVMSIGGGNYEQIRSSVETVLKYNKNLVILHCVSEYPCPAENLGLNNILKLKENFEGVTVGVSDHFNGTLSGPIARMLGAEVFEKHVTMNRSWKGTDHSFALEREGFRKFVRDIHRVDVMLEPKKEEEIGKEPVFQKLGKSLIASQNISKGTVIKTEHLDGVIDIVQHIPVRRSNEVIGKRLIEDIDKGQFIKFESLV